MNTKKRFDTVGFLMAIDEGTLPEEKVVEGFQHLIDNGTVWALEGRYGTAAQALIDAKKCVMREPESTPGKVSNIGPYSMIWKDEIRDVGSEKFRIAISGAYNAMGLIGPEVNGIVVFRESPPQVIADQIEKQQSGYFGASREQLQLFNKMLTCSPQEFVEIVNSSDRLRMRIDVIEPQEEKTLKKSKSNRM